LIRTEEDIDILAKNGSKSDVETDDPNSLKRSVAKLHSQCVLMYAQ